MTLGTSQVSVQVKEMRKTSGEGKGIRREKSGGLVHEDDSLVMANDQKPRICTSDQRKIGLCSMKNLSPIVFGSAGQSDLRGLHCGPHWVPTQWPQCKAGLWFS